MEVDEGIKGINGNGKNIIQINYKKRKYMKSISEIRILLNGT